MFDPNVHQHVRYNPLKREWVLVSPHRMLRPWSGQVDSVPDEDIPEHDPTNPLCPGVKRATGVITPDYKSTYVFTNDFPALLEDGPTLDVGEDPLFQVKPATGTCRVMCFHPKSDVHLATMTTEQVLDIINEWIQQTKELGRKYQWVQIFENRGAMMGCSNPHPHCQIWASSFLPNEARLKDEAQSEYYSKYKRSLLQDYAKREVEKRERIIYENSEWIVVVPYWAVWPFETMVLPKRQIQRFTDADETQRNELAELLRGLTSKYDNLFKCAFPYSMGWHGAPTGEKFGQDQPHWTFHGAYYPPLLRSATIRKFSVGYELLAQNQRDLTPEKAAGMLRKQSETHYKLTK